MSDGIPPFEAYLRNATDAATAVRVGASYSKTDPNWIKARVMSARANLDAANQQLERWAESFAPPPSQPVETPHEGRGADTP